MTPALLKKVGEALYGPSWRGSLATALGVAERTVRRWAVGDSEMPPGLNEDLALLCERQGDRLRKLIVEIVKDHLSE